MTDQAGSVPVVKHSRASLLRRQQTVDASIHTSVDEQKDGVKLRRCNLPSENITFTHKWKKHIEF